MKSRRLLALSVLAIALGCQDQKGPTAPAAAKAPPDPSAIISDGAHCGPVGSIPACNRDFFFLPPMVPLPVGNPHFELGKFNNTLKPSLRIEICELQAQYNAQGLPTAGTQCVAGSPKKTFAPGTVKLVNLPLRENGWWSLFNLPPDGFYYVLWDTRQSNLSVNKFYRIKVLIAGSTEPLGIADVDPMSSLFQWKFSRTGDVVQMIDDVLLPIPFRVERSALCPGEHLCTSATVTNHTPNGQPQIVRVQGSDGSYVAGVLIPDGFLPETGPQSVVLTITRVNTGANDVAAGTQAIPCHANLPLQQFNSCFNFSTIPQLATINEDGHQFLKALTVAVCFVLHDTEDAREPFVQLFSSDPGEEAKPLPGASATQILSGPGGESCGDNLDVALDNSSNGFTRFASAGWKKVKNGLGRVFGVQTAYAIDVGLGGLTFDLSNIGPAMNARMTGTEVDPDVSVEVGETTTLNARIVGTLTHDGSLSLNTGIRSLPVTFSLDEGNTGSLRLLGSEAPPSSQVTDITNFNVIFPGSLGSGGGFAAANFTAPMTPGLYTVTATSPYAKGSLVFHITVRPPDIGLNNLIGSWFNENGSTGNNTRVQISVDGSAVFVHAWGACSPTECDWGSTNGDISRWTSDQEITAVWDQGFVISTQTITYLSATRLQIVNHYDFVPPDTRTDFTTAAEFFTKEAPIP